MAESAPTSEQGSELTSLTANDDFHVDLRSGKGLSFSEANSITQRGLARVILFSGTAKSGKTTLLSSLYLLFHRQPFAGYLFAGCDTFVGFEERNYYVEIDSGLSKPTMERTVVSEALHLIVRREDFSQPPVELLLCDISAEDFEEAKDSMDACRQMGVIRRADTFVLLVDGAKLVDPASRQRAKNDPLMFLRSCLDGGMLNPDAAVDVLITKWDLIEANASNGEIIGFAESLESAILRQFGSRLIRLHVARIAAHPFESELPLGFGLNNLFHLWVEHRVQVARHLATATIWNPSVGNECDRYLFRRLSPQIQTKL